MTMRTYRQILDDCAAVGGPFVERLYPPQDQVSAVSAALTVAGIPHRVLTIEVGTNEGDRRIWMSPPQRRVTLVGMGLLP